MAEKHETLAAALAAAQAEMGRAQKDARNPHFKSAYATLASVMSAALPALSKHGIAVTQPVRRGEDGEPVVITCLHYRSEVLEDDGMPLLVNKRDMQGLGSALTYARRYGLMAMCGIAAEDDDGNAAAASPEGSRSASDAAPPPFEGDEAVAIRDRMKTAVANAADASALARLIVDQHYTAHKKRLPEPMQAELTALEKSRAAELEPAQKEAAE